MCIVNVTEWKVLRFHCFWDDMTKYGTRMYLDWFVQTTGICQLVKHTKDFFFCWCHRGITVSKCLVAPLSHSLHREKGDMAFPANTLEDFWTSWIQSHAIVQPTLILKEVFQHLPACPCWNTTPVVQVLHLTLLPGRWHCRDSGKHVQEPWSRSLESDAGNLPRSIDQSQNQSIPKTS